MTARSSLIDEARAHWPGWELAMFNELGNTATLFVPGAPRRSASGLTVTTFTTRRQHANGVEATVTSRVSGSATALYSWGTPLALTKASNWKGRSPVLTLNGSTEHMDTPDADYWSRGNGTTDSAFSVGAWVNFVDATSCAVLGKWDTTTGAAKREWSMFFGADDTAQFLLYDESASAQLGKVLNSAQEQNMWNHYIWTYDGSSANAGMKCYKNGTLATTANGNSGVYVAMENAASLMYVGARLGAAAMQDFFDGKMAVGPGACPFYTQVELTAAQAKNLYLLGADVLGL